MAINLVHVPNFNHQRRNKKLLFVTFLLGTQTIHKQLKYQCLHGQRIKRMGINWVHVSR
jgi:hypothetical protein